MKIVSTCCKEMCEAGSGANCKHAASQPGRKVPVALLKLLQSRPRKSILFFKGSPSRVLKDPKPSASQMQPSRCSRSGAGQSLWQPGRLLV